MSGFRLDTNVISAFAKPELNEPAISWLKAATPETLFVSVITLGEMRLGIENLPTGKRRNELEQWLETGLPGWFETNLLPVTKAIGERWGRLAIEAKRKGMTLGTPDGLIAATAFDHGLTVVTRNEKDFEGLGVPILNPWDERGELRSSGMRWFLVHFSMRSDRLWWANVFGQSCPGFCSAP